MTGKAWAAKRASFLAGYGLVGHTLQLLMADAEARHAIAKTHPAPEAFQDGLELRAAIAWILTADTSSETTDDVQKYDDLVARLNVKYGQIAALSHEGPLGLRDDAVTDDTPRETTHPGSPDIEPFTVPAQRWQNALAWWWIAEVMRRHPSLKLSEEVTNYGHQDSLVLYRRWDSQWQRLVTVNRNGAVHFPSGDVPPIQDPWTRHLGADDAHHLIHEIEALAKLPRPANTPQATPTSISVRLIAAALMTTVHEREPWTCRSWASLASGVVTPVDGLDVHFPAASCTARSTWESDPGRHWVMCRAGSPRAVVDLVEGLLHRSDDGHPTDILVAYQTHGRSLQRTIASELRGLP